MSDPEDNVSAYSEPRRGRHPSRSRSRSGRQSEAKLLPNPQATLNITPGRDNTCHLWRDTGKCRYGDMCKFEHVGGGRGTVRSRVDHTDIPTPKHPLVQILARCDLPHVDAPSPIVTPPANSQPGTVEQVETVTANKPLPAAGDVVDVYPAKLKFGEKSRVVRLDGHITVGDILSKYGSKSGLNVCKDKDGVELDHDLTLTQVI